MPYPKRIDKYLRKEIKRFIQNRNVDSISMNNAVNAINEINV